MTQAVWRLRSRRPRWTRRWNPWSAALWCSTASFAWCSGTGALKRFIRWLKGQLAPQVPFKELLKEKARHHLENASDEEQQRWVEQRVAVQRNPRAA